MPPPPTHKDTTLATILVPHKREDTGESLSLVDLNPFGSAVVAATWITLIALNLWCWKKVLSREEKKTEGA